MDSSILLPLYIYPHPGAWDPLYASVSAYPNLQFLIIINPNSGPGSAPWWPNEDYTREIPRLNACPNVTVLGYVRATYCKRNGDELFQDIETYAERSQDEKHHGLEVQGIFVDETTNLFSEEVKKYLDTTDRKVKESDGIGGNRLVVHNPGTAVYAQLADPGPDITVVVETSYNHFMTAEYQEWLATSPYGRDRSCYMVHSVPGEVVPDFTVGLRERAKYLFVTSTTENFYESFSPCWERFVEAVVEG